MISTLDIIDKIYLVLNVPEIVNFISGEVVKKVRPINSQSEDIVINALPTNNLQVQTAIVNVNIHVPNITVDENKTQSSIINYARLREITAIVKPFLEKKYFADFWIDIQQQMDFSEDQIAQHYTNIRVEFYSLNI